MYNIILFCILPRYRCLCVLDDKRIWIIVFNFPDIALSGGRVWIFSIFFAWTRFFSLLFFPCRGETRRIHTFKFFFLLASINQSFNNLEFHQLWMSEPMNIHARVTQNYIFIHFFKKGKGKFNLKIYHWIINLFLQLACVSEKVQID